MNLIRVEDYYSIIDDNPLLQKHPDYIRDASMNSRDFMFMSNDNEATAPNDVNDTQNVLIQPSQNNNQPQNDRQELLKRKDSMDEFTKDYD